MEGNTYHGNTSEGISVNGDSASTGPDVFIRIGMLDGTGNTISQNETGIKVRNAWAHVYNNTMEENQTGVKASENSIIFLGSADSPGGNTIKNSTHVGLANQSNRRVSARGNTWNQSVQGADGEGHYVPGLVEGPVPAQDGNNYSIGSQYGSISF